MGLPLPKELTLDCSKWVCGELSYSHHNKLGDDTAMLNSYGQMCCLGQFSEQAGLLSDELLNSEFPEECDRTVTSFVRGGVITKLAKDAIEINDNGCTTVKEKILALKELFAKNGRKIKVKNYKKATGKNWSNK
jgi:hypothetical protein